MRASGFTLIELVVVLAVAGVLMSVAAPSFRETVQDVRLVGETNRWSRTLRLARSEAIKRGAPVTVCARASDAACGTTWSNGWIVYADASGSGTAGAFDTGDALIARHAGAPVGITRKASGFVRPDGTETRSAVAFDARGRPDWTLGTLVLCDARGADDARALIVGGAGGVRAVEAASGAPVKDASGTAVSCP